MCKLYGSSMKFSGIHMKMLITVICIAVFSIQNVYGDNFFEATFLIRLQCYGTKQKGCNTEFTDAHPEVAYSYSNLTKATTFLYMFPNGGDAEKPELMHKCGGELPPETKFNPKCRTEIFVPGFISGVCNYAIFRELKDERLKYNPNSDCYNVLLVDYMWGNSPDLKGAKINLKIVAEQLAIVVRGLMERFPEYTLKQFICTGHSYGAHACGFLGQILKIGVINGIDPAGVLFTEDTDLDDRLDKGDADCVHVMHCNGGQCLLGYFGVNFTCGHLDHWINGGLFQASCYKQILISYIKGDIVYATASLLLSAACSHFHCLQYYKASMNPTDCQFVGAKCPSYVDFKQGQCRDCGSNGENCSVMGAYSCDCRKNDEEGDYYLNTKFNCPFCDKYGINTNGLTCPATIINK